MNIRTFCLRALGVCLGVIFSLVIPAISGAAQPAPPSPSTSPTVHNWRPIRLPPDQVSPPPPSNLHPGAPVPVEPAPVRPSSTAITAAAGTCLGSQNNPASTHHAYSLAFTTCGTAIGTYALWVPDQSRGFYSVDSCCSTAHVNATAWYPSFTSDGRFYGLEAGFLA